MIGLNWVPEPDKFLSRTEVNRLLETAAKRAVEALKQGRKAPVRDYLLVHLALATGLRVMEIAQLNCGDFFVKDHFSSLLVRNGKGRRKRLVHFDSSLKRHYTEYVFWKQMVGEPVGPEAPLFLSSNTRTYMTTRAMEKAFKRTAARAGLPSHYSIHCLRHTYACQLYKASGYNLRFVQKQLGHASYRTTEVYADVVKPDIRHALERLYR
jgi:site-specific recombinase XerD